MRTISEILSTAYENLSDEEKKAYLYCNESKILLQRSRDELTDDERAAYDYWSASRTTPIPVPVLSGEYVHIYQPQGQVYRSCDHPLFKSGDYCENWVSNDFTIINDGEKWHMIGITGPRLPKEIYRDEFDRTPGLAHGPELQLFHAVAEGETFSEVFSDKSFKDCGNILSSCDRPTERPEIWAPYLVKRDDGFHLVYSPQRIRQRITKDFKTWSPAPDLFVSESESARDINVYEENGISYVIYVKGKSVVYRTSEDFLHWSEEKVLYTCHFKNGDPESPFLIKNGEFYYLFWCLFDGQNGSFDNRTYVFASNTLEGLNDSAPITMLPAHAPELVKDNDGTWYLLSAYYPKNGINAVKLEFKPRYIPKP